MRKLGFLVVLALALTMSASVFAKTKFADRGKMALSGGASLTINSSKADADGAEWFTTTNLTLAPTFGYFVINGLLVGATPVIGISSPEEGDNTYTYGIGPTVAYFAKLMGSMFIGGGGTVFYAGTKTGDVSGSGYGVRLFGGPTLAFGGKFGGFVNLYAFFQYSAHTTEMESAGITVSSDYNQMGLGVGTDIGVFF
jgi:hypothetical protein